jgi:hypothetical protein
MNDGPDGAEGCPFTYRPTCGPFYRKVFGLFSAGCPAGARTRGGGSLHRVTRRRSGTRTAERRQERGGGAPDAPGADVHQPGVAVGAAAPVAGAAALAGDAARRGHHLPEGLGRWRARDRLVRDRHGAFRALSRPHFTARTVASPLRCARAISGMW